jgi:hypothetical protein
MSGSDPLRVDRRTTIKWMLAASASVPLLKGMSWPAAASRASVNAKGYGTDPDLQKIHSPGELWPLTLTPELRRTAAVLCDAIIPADAHSPSASSVGVADFVDEWISAPYPRQREDREVILAGFEWLDAESGRRFSRPFAALDAAQQSAICDDVCYLPKARPALTGAAKFFARYRDLTAGGFYTTPAGNKDLQYVGNVPLASFDGPALEVLKAVGLV